MIHMPVDDSLSSFSSSYRTIRNISMNPGKRARSPEGSGSPGDRPSKRPSLAIPDVSRRPSYRHLSLSSASSSRQASEDWVQQTGGLTIDSPIYPSSDHAHSFAAQSEEGSGDVDMVMESEEISTVQENPARPHLAPLRNSPYSHSNPELHLQHGVQIQPNAHRHPYGTRYAEKMHASAIPPLIHVVPATPVTSEHPLLQRLGGIPSTSQLMYSVSQPSTPPPSDLAPMAISPVASFAQLASPMSPKRRVVFGPRSNCEKCRVGERHFIHYE